MDDYLQLTPSKELAFHRPFTAVVKQTLNIRNNNSDSPICFKVKTTAPKQYCVRPNSSVVAPNAEAEVQVLLQSMKDDPPEGFICKDKFLIQSIKVPSDVLKLEGDELQNRLQTLWTQAEQLKKTSPAAAAEVLLERKLKCVFLPPIAESGAAPQSNGQAARVQQSEVTRQPSLRSEFSDANTSPRSSVIAAESSLNAAVDKQLREARQKINTLQSACDGYKAEIERLNLLRQRRGADSKDTVSSSSSGSSATVMTPAPLTGLSLQVVAAVALAAFLLGAFLF
ncbi:PapD-like protein [Phlyctochytrium arcticum]|nr:PapD-like protein [Phlyctochytrium arcticum]